MQKESDILFLIMPAYNEEANIEKVLQEWYPVVGAINQESRLVIVNDGSTDKTQAILERYKRTHPQLIILHTQNQGHGRALLTGYQFALSKNADYIAQTDSDGQTNPDLFPTFWRERTKHNLLIGYRKHRMDGFSRVLVTKALRLVLYGIFREWVKDANCPYRLMKRDSLSEILKRLPEKPELINVLITIGYAHKRDIGWYEIPFMPRQGGKNSIRPYDAVKIGIRNIKNFKDFRTALTPSNKMSVSELLGALKDREYQKDELGYICDLHQQYNNKKEGDHEA